MSGNLLTLGCDPELIPVRPRKGYIPAWELTKGTKADPELLKHPENNIGLKIQADGSSLEFNIDPIPINNMDDCKVRWPTRIQHAIQLMQDAYKIVLEAHPVVTLEHYVNPET